MSKEKLAPEAVEATSLPLVEQDFPAKIVKTEDGYHVVDQDGTTGPVCKIVDDGKTIALTKNASNRQWFNIVKAEEAIAADGYCGLTFKESRKLDTSTPRIPNDKLIAYLPDDLRTEYNAIIARAVAAREADKAQPKTEAEKLQDKIAALKAKLANLEAGSATSDAPLTADDMTAAQA